DHRHTSLAASAMSSKRIGLLFLREEPVIGTRLPALPAGRRTTERRARRVRSRVTLHLHDRRVDSSPRVRQEFRMRAILVPVADRPECHAALDVAFDVATRLGADVLGCRFRAVPIEPGNGDFAGRGARRPRRAWRALDEEAAARAAEAAKRLCEPKAATAGFPMSTEPGSRARPHACWEAIVGAPT